MDLREASVIKAEEEVIAPRPSRESESPSSMQNVIPTYLSRQLGVELRALILAYERVPIGRPIEL